jgi:4-amino-4-deoxy-L-arabinose transferase-like glycosyltransferase
LLAWSKVDTLLLAGITIIAGAIRLFRLGAPAQLPASVCDTSQELSWTHPPLGKWLLAVGITACGYTPFGRRIAAAAMGTLAVALLYLLARKILQSRFAGAVAASLLAIDWLHFVQSRTAMLDVFLCTFVVAAFLFLACDRDRLVLERGISPGRRGPLSRPWRLASGVMGGAATRPNGRER